MQNLLKQIVNLTEQEIGTNKINSFLPYRKGAKEFDFESVGCSVLSRLMGKQVKRSYTFEKYKHQCLGYLEGKLSDPVILSDLEKIYFSDEKIANTAPEFLLLRSQEKGNASTKHLIGLFNSFFSDGMTEVKFESATNFIEKVFLGILSENLQELNLKPSEACYLPFVADCFRKDVLFLSKHTDYFLEQLPSCIELYTFIYCAQLGLNIRSWKDGATPTSKPLYFIVDTEKASRERSNLWKHGYQSVADPMSEVFPILSMLEHLNNDESVPSQPLWAFAAAINSADKEVQVEVLSALTKFAEDFRDDRSLAPIPNPPTNAIDGMQQLIAYAVKQFAEGTGRHRVAMQYMDVFHKEVAKNFIQARGRSGKVLVVNQDFILLLTNLAVADRKSIRFQELLSEFQHRGFYFDKSSQQALINFFERVGNVDRMSDSGDAVYVRSTI